VIIFDQTIKTEKMKNLKFILPIFAAIMLVSCDPAKKAAKSNDMEPEFGQRYDTLFPDNLALLQEKDLQIKTQYYFSKEVKIERTKQEYDTVYVNDAGDVFFSHKTPLKVIFRQNCPATFVSALGGLKVTAEGEGGRLSVPFRTETKCFKIPEKFFYEGFEYEVTEGSDALVFVKKISNPNKAREAEGKLVNQSGTGTRSGSTKTREYDNSYESRSSGSNNQPALNQQPAQPAQGKVW